MNVIHACKPWIFRTLAMHVAHGWYVRFFF
jgi:hypothetical protein